LSFVSLRRVFRLSHDYLGIKIEEKYVLKPWMPRGRIVAWLNAHAVVK
jgi:hypothetical protein